MKKIISGLVVICGLAGCMTQSEVDAVKKAARIGAAKAAEMNFRDVGKGPYFDYRVPDIDIGPDNKPRPSDYERK